MDTRMNPFPRRGLAMLVRHGTRDTYDRARLAGEAAPMREITWLAERGNSTAMQIVEAMTKVLTDEVIAERWPDQDAQNLRADLKVRVMREVRERLKNSSERHRWRWN